LIRQEGIDLISQGWKVITSNAHAFLQKVVGVSFLLTGNGIGVPEDFDMTCGNALCVKGRNKRIRCAKMALGGGRGQNHYGILFRCTMFCHPKFLFISVFIRYERGA
jgi:hypothetical protein